MRVLFFDCFSGISGDMTMGALLDLGIDIGAFRQELDKLGLEGYGLEITRKAVNGIVGTDVSVVLTDLHEADHETCDPTPGDGDSPSHSSHSEPSNLEHHHHGHSHSHEHGDHGMHDHVHTDSAIHVHSHCDTHNGCQYTHVHSERNLKDINLIIDRSSLSGRVKAFSKAVFLEIAAAEAKVHDRDIDEVHFHEVGAVDSIVDIVGTAICMEMLGIEKVCSSELHDGKGSIVCRHGTIPVPVPAVMEMLAGSGIPLISENVGTELVTPTGMALIKHMAKDFGQMPPMLVEKTGYGMGKRETGRFNALRAVLGNIYDEKQEAEEIVVLETNIDDMSPEILGYASSRLFEAGALDVFYTPIYMKKSRPAFMLTVLAKAEAEKKLADIVLKETSTLGIRRTTCKRYCMRREIVTVDTEYGTARVKVAALGDFRKASPEYEDCRKMAESAGIPLTGIYEAVMKNAEKYLQGKVDGK